jgi:type 1 fimbria pilin
MMKKSIATSAALMTALFAGFSAPAHASNGNEIRLRLRAEVAPFCKIWVEGTDSINVVDGKADIGNVREVCNTQGYSITANFSNLNAGTLSADADSTNIDILGLAQFTYGEAGSNTRFWRLSDATPVEPTSPVFMQVVISPL